MEIVEKVLPQSGQLQFGDVLDEEGRHTDGRDVQHSRVGQCLNGEQFGHQVHQQNHLVIREQHRFIANLARVCSLLLRADANLQKQKRETCNL